MNANTVTFNQSKLVRAVTHNLLQKKKTLEKQTHVEFGKFD